MTTRAEFQAELDDWRVESQRRRTAQTVAGAELDAATGDAAKGLQAGYDEATARCEQHAIKLRDLKARVDAVLGKQPAPADKAEHEARFTKTKLRALDRTKARR